MITKRHFLKGSLAVTTAGWLPGYASAVAANAATDKRLVVVLLRGGMDGLAAVPPVGDPHYRSARAGLALSEAHHVNDLFALHPSMTEAAGLYHAGDLAVIHAAATPYRARSHFDGQDILETGADGLNGLRDGWLNRTIAVLGNANGGGAQGVAIGTSVPLILRGAAPAASMAPGGTGHVDDGFINQVEDLYAGDPRLGKALAEAVAARALSDSASGPARRRQPLTGLVGLLAKLMAAPDGARIAVVEGGGWDTHANQGAEQGRLANQLSRLDQGLAAARDGFGPLWDRTVFLIVTEFGRTVAANGTGGTDHGTASAALLAGGAVRGGTVTADWPGLANRDLHEGRDLKATTDLRAVFKGVLGDHLGLDRADLDTVVFPGSHRVRPMNGLIRV